MSVSKMNGKKRALSAASGDSAVVESEPMTAPEERRIKKPKKAETRVCPVCEDTIPVRLLASHVVFELQRVEEICQARMEDEDLVPWEQVEEDIFNTAGPSRRTAAVRARRSLNPGQSHVSAPGTSKTSAVAQVSKTLKLVQRHRRERHIKLKEMSRADLEIDQHIPTAERRVCPVCQIAVNGENDIVEAHIDACLAHASAAAITTEAELAADGLEEYEVGGETRIRISGSVNFREIILSSRTSTGAGYDVRNPHHNDVEDEIDVDGDDSFGAAQFTEGDIILPDSTESEEVIIDSAEEDETASIAQQRLGTSLRELVAQGKVVLKSGGNGVATTTMVSTVIDSFAGLEFVLTYQQDSATLGGLMCRICLDPYADPTVSTGCWHTCCKECWLRCLGSTKLCPICKRITAAGDLRRIYL
ncbi:hypothetical protein BU17DRAFT_74761 [Hysterangium stoloniferum]|nr:hypothetical protein BU17DRAFT_74761 [Hysterangium stoloniferum]